MSICHHCGGKVSLGGTVCALCSRRECKGTVQFDTDEYGTVVVCTRPGCSWRGMYATHDKALIAWDEHRESHGVSFRSRAHVDFEPKDVRGIDKRMTAWLKEHEHQAA